jgi:hypothetical protein
MFEKTKSAFDAIPLHNKLAALATPVAFASWAMVDLVLRDAAAIASFTLSAIGLYQWWKSRK